MCIAQIDGHFNSIKVRLKHTQCHDVGRGIVFQFHKGTIKTRMKTFKIVYAHISIP